MKRDFVLAAVLLLSALGHADDDSLPKRHQIEAAAPNDPPIKITINPEARVSAVMAGALPPSVPCGTAAGLSVRIVNQGFVTAQLEAEFLGAVPAGTTLDFQPEALKGVPEELRELHITLTKPGPTDLTIAFKAHNEVPDLGGRNRVHFLVQCLQTDTGAGQYRQLRK